MVTGEPTLRSPILSKIGGDVVPAFGGAQLQAGRGQLGSQEKHGHETQQHEQAGAELEGTIRLHVTILLQERRGQDVVQQQREHGRSNNSACRGEPYSRGGRLGVVPLIHGNETAGQPENDAFDEALVDVMPTDGALHLRPERALVDAQELHRPPAARQTDR